MKNSRSKIQLPRGCNPTGHGICYGDTDVLPEKATLPQMVRHYQKSFRPRLKKRLKAYRELTWVDALTNAVHGKEVDENIKRMDHLRRIEIKAMDKAYKVLSDPKTKLKSCKGFDALYTMISEVVFKTKGLGEMYAYDVALRIGANLKLKPKHVYLQRGVRVGAEKFLGRRCKERFLKCSDFEPGLKGLNAAEVEDFLCLFKHYPALKNKA